MDLNSLSTSSTTTSSLGGPDGGDDDVEIVERDPTGRYVRYAEILGEGATKTVYKAFDEVDGIEVAWNQIELSEEILKSGKQLQKLCSEANLMKSLKHENVIRCFHSWIDTENKTINMITELFTSGNLRLYRDKHGHLANKAIKKWATQILKGLDYLHSHSPPIVHRDLKCENIFVNGSSGKVKIGDLGLATVLQHATAHSVIGTPEFMAPELYEEDYDQRVDIYSFGMCMLQMVTRELPYSECKNPAQVYRRVTSGIKPAALSKVTDPQVREFIEKCVAPVSERLSANDLLNDPFLVLSDSGRATCNPSLVESVCSSISSSSAHRIISTPAPLELMKVSVSEKKTFKLQGNTEGKDSVLMTLWMADLGGDAKKIEFVFFLQTDTVASVTEEMVKELELSVKDAALVANLMAELILELAPHSKAIICQKLSKPEDDLNLSNMPAEESTNNAKGLPVVGSPHLAEYDPARKSEYTCSSSKDPNSSQIKSRSFDQDQKKKHDNNGREEDPGDKRKRIRKNHKELTGRLLVTCLRKLLFRCGS